MRLIIDLQALQTGSQYRGIGQYSRSLVREMLKQREDHKVLLLINNYSDGDLEKIYSQLEDLIDISDIRIFRALPNMIEILSDDSYLIEISELIRNVLIERLQPDAVLVTSLFEGGHEDCVVSIDDSYGNVNAVIGYDVIPLISPDKYLADKRSESWYLRKIESLQRADLILSISESASREFEKYLELGDEVVKTISTACSSEYTIRDWDEYYEAFLLGLGVTKHFILYSGAADERKNIRGLLTAFAGLDKVLRDSYQIVLVGKYNDTDQTGLVALSKKLGIERADLFFTGFVTNEQLSFLYSKCSLFVFPSFHEGFGLPVLEAISCGAPTICSNTTSLPEVLNFPEAMFDPSSTEAITACMSRVLKDEEFRQQLIAHGLEQAKQFSWSRVAESAWRLLGSAVQQKQDSLSNHQSDSFERLKKLLDDDRCNEQIRRWVSECLAANDNEVDEPETSNRQQTWRIEGPFDSSYSLALLNRETARALNRAGQNVVLHSTEGPGDFDPNQEYLNNHSDIRQMYQSSRAAVRPDIVSRNLYPPRTTDMLANTKIFHHYAWEESGFPRDWVQSFNKGLGGVTTLSEHVRKILIDNGVTLPLPVTGCGVDHWTSIKAGNYPIEAKSFRFLHVSSCFPRKGIDVLLQAYGNVFNNSDDVTLIIKTFENPHNNVLDQLAEQRRINPNYPEVLVIFEDLSSEDLKSVYEQCHALIAPSKAEGFGLPMAEALLSGLPVITTAWGGQLDFCNHENSWLVDYNFAPAQTHFSLPLSVWAEPDVYDLGKKIRELYETEDSIRQQKVRRAVRLLNRKFEWDQVASRLLQASEKISAFTKPTRLKIGWVSTWNQKCGIAAYSEHLVTEDAYHENVIFAPKTSQTTKTDNKDVIRCWDQNDQDSLEDLWKAIQRQNLDALVIQMNTYFYDYAHLLSLLKRVKSQGIQVLLTLHATAPIEERKAINKLRPCLDLVDRVIVHTIDDLNRLKAARIINNAMILPHGILDRKPSSPRPAVAGKQNRKVVATYGFALPNKGIEQLIDAFVNIAKRRNDIELLLLNAEHSEPISGQFIESLKKKINDTGFSDRINMVNDFLEFQECIDRLSVVDVIAMPYQKTGESSSAAVRMAIASRAPVVVTPLSIFDDAIGAVDYFEAKDHVAIESGIEKILNGGRIITNADVEKWCASHSYSVISERFFQMIHSLVVNAKFDHW